MLGASPKLQLATRFLMKHHQGPLPASEDYAEYERVHEGSAGRILAMAEDSRRDAAALRARDLELDYHEAARGQWFAFILAFSAIGAGTFLGYTDHQVAGSIIGGAGLVSLVVAFIQGKRRNSN